MDELVISAQNLSKTYPIGSSEVKALQNVNFSIREGEIIGVYGPSGSGKSTLLHILATLESNSKGTLTFDKISLKRLTSNQIAELRQKIGFVFQDYNLISRLTALENVCLGLDIQGRYSRKKRKELAQKTLEFVGLQARLNHKPGELSGGEQQRVAIARAIVQEPRILLMDEPTGNVDSETKKLLLDLIYRINQEKHLSIIIASHDPSIKHICNRIIELIDGEISNITEGSISNQNLGEIS